jgi:hypothetical protein
MCPTYRVLLGYCIAGDFERHAMASVSPQNRPQQVQIKPRKPQ